MSAVEIIDQIKNLPIDEQVEVIRFAYQIDAECQLTGKELSSLAERMVHAKDCAEAAMLSAPTLPIHEVRRSWLHVSAPRKRKRHRFRADRLEHDLLLGHHRERVQIGIGVQNERVLADPVQRRPDAAAVLPVAHAAELLLMI